MINVITSNKLKCIVFPSYPPPPVRSSYILPLIYDSFNYNGCIAFWTYVTRARARWWKIFSKGRTREGKRVLNLFQGFCLFFLPYISFASYGCAQISRIIRKVVGLVYDVCKCVFSCIVYGNVCLGLCNTVYVAFLALPQWKRHFIFMQERGHGFSKGSRLWNCGRRKVNELCSFSVKVSEFDSSGRGEINRILYIFGQNGI